MTYFFIVNFLLGAWLLHLALHPMHRVNRPMTWTRFWINAGVGLANLISGLWGFYLWL